MMKTLSISGPINDRIDDACRTKYQHSRTYAPPPHERAGARSATVKVMPREMNA